MIKKNEIAIFIAILFVAGFFATYKLTESPGVWYDEGFYVQAASNLATDGQMGLRIAPNFIEPSSKLISVGYPLIYPLALGFKIFGVNILTARSVMVIFILGFLVASYFLARRLFGNTFALGVLALLATLPPLYGNGKSVLGEVPGLFYLILFLLFFNLARSSTTKKYLWFVLTGISAGLCVATKPTFLLLLPAIAVGVLFEWRRGNLNFKEIFVVSLSTIAPIIYWLVSQFQTEDSLGGVLFEYANPYQITDMLHVILVNLGHLFTDVGTLYLTGIMFIWFLALGIRFKAKEKISAEEIMALVFSLLIIVAYTRTAGWYRYLFEAQAISLLFFPNALFTLFKRVHIPQARKIVLATTLLLTFLGAYQVMFNSWVAESYNSHKSAFWQTYFNAMPTTTSLFFYDVPEVAFFSLSDNYYQYISPSGWPIGKEQLVVLEKGEADIIIVRSDTYKSRRDTIFHSYQIDQTAYKYTILQKKKSRY